MTPRRSNGLTFLDFFAGFGGSSSGLVEAGFELATAYNHWDKAIAVHSANHRKADHVQGDLSGYDMRRLPKGVPFLWASPECTWHSPAGGRKKPRRDATLDLFDDYVPNAAGERSRATMFDPIRATEARSFDAIAIENVPEVADWPLFPSWLRMWEDLGYAWQIVNASAAHVYSESNAPAGQWRDRIYIVLTKKGIRMPRIEPRPPAWCEQCGAVVEAVQSWKRKDLPIRVGKYGRQYVYVCGANQHPRQVVEPYVLPAAAVIDWSDLGERIGDRKRPLAAATMRRVEVGARMFARPAVVAHHGETWDAANPRHPRFGELDAYYRAWSADGAPLMARNASGGDAISVPPFLTAVNHDSDHRAQMLSGGPLPTRSTKIGDGLVFPPFVTHQYGQTAGDEFRSKGLTDPLGTVVASGSHHALVVPPYLVEYFGTSTAREARQPLSAVLAGAAHHGLAIPPGAFLSKHHGGMDYERIEHMNKSVMEPMPSLVTRPNVSLVIPTRKRPESMYEGELPFDLDDVRFRMLGPKEHLRSQRFWEDYDTSAANKSETTKGAGNAVPVNVAHWIGSEVADAMGAAA